MWNDIPVGIDAAGGGGPSHVFPRPPFQFGIAHRSGFARATPDISLSAAVDGGVLVYLSFPGLDLGATTSSAAPARPRRCSRASWPSPTRSPATGSGWINPRLYGIGTNANKGIVDVTIGDNTFTLLDADGNPLFTVPGYKAVRGYDMASGLGTVDALRFTHALAGR